jgi:hypothetical protein
MVRYFHPMAKTNFQQQFTDIDEEHAIQDFS